MPFDAMVAGKPSLANELMLAGVTPVAMDVLEKHKAEQVRKHPASFMVRDSTYIGVAVVVAAVVAAMMHQTAPGGLAAIQVAAAVMLVGMVTILVTVAMGLLVAAVAAVCDIRFFAQAQWYERNVTGRWVKMPDEIKALVRRVHQQMPEAALIYGELRQEEVLLDPYIVVQLEGERACLGIWDGEQVIACAQID